MFDLLSIALSTIGVLMSIITFISTIQIKKLLKRESDKKQFLRERHIYVEKLEDYCERINEKYISYEEILKILRDIHRTLEQITIYKIWDDNLLDTLKDFIQKTVYIINELDSYADSDKRFSPDIPVKIRQMRESKNQWNTCLYCYTPSSSSRYYDLEKTVITQSFKNEYVILLNKIIAIMKTDSSIK